MQNDNVHEKEIIENASIFSDNTEEFEIRKAVLFEENLHKNTFAKSHFQQLEEITSDYHRALNKIEVILVIIFVKYKPFNMIFFRL